MEVFHHLRVKQAAQEAATGGGGGKGKKKGAAPLPQLPPAPEPARQLEMEEREERVPLPVPPPLGPMPDPLSASEDEWETYSALCLQHAHYNHHRGVRVQRRMVPAPVAAAPQQGKAPKWQMTVTPLPREGGDWRKTEEVRGFLVRFFLRDPEINVGSYFAWHVLPNLRERAASLIRKQNGRDYRWVERYPQYAEFFDTDHPAGSHTTMQTYLQVSSPSTYLCETSCVSHPPHPPGGAGPEAGAAAGVRQHHGH